MTKQEITYSSIDELEARLDDLNGNGKETFEGEFRYIEEQIAWYRAEVKRLREKRGYDA